MVHWDLDETKREVINLGYDDIEFDDFVNEAWEKAWREENGVVELDLDCITAESDEKGFLKRFQSELSKIISELEEKTA